MVPADHSLSADVESGTMADRVRMLADRAAVGLAFSVTCAIFLVAMYWAAGNALHLLGWLAIMLALSGARLAQILSVRSVPAVRTPERWALEHAGLSVLLGAMWGYAGVVLAAVQPPELRMFGYLVPAGICAGVLATYSAYYPSVVGFTLASMVPITIGLLFQVVDDLLDREGESAVLGKTAGKDAAAGKVTFPELLGTAAAHAYADDLLAEALAALDLLAAETGHLAELARFIRHRDR